MPFCPSCKYEYNDDVVKCPDCDEFLVEELPIDDSDEAEFIDLEKDDYVQIARLTSDSYADMIVEALNSKDIPAIALSGTGHFSKIGTMGPSSAIPIDGTISIMVPEEFVADADREAEIILGDTWRTSRTIEVDEDE